jgi:predicted RNase H-like HicB family nuclease
MYRLVITWEDDLDGYFGRTAEMPSVMADGPTVEECARETMNATIASIATLLEKGEPVPAPASEGRRDQQVNVRLTLDEKDRIDAAARQAGFRSVSDFIRHAALDKAS